MTDAHPIVAEAMALADQQNALVIVSAFGFKLCGQCQYLQNPQEFSQVLSAYTKAKLRWLRVQGGVSYGRVEPGGYEQAYLTYSRYKDKLAALWPCESCIVLYNPTNRHRAYAVNVRRTRTST